MELGFNGAKAVVTGGSKGMGLAIAESLGAEGAAVAIMARGRSALDSAAERIRNAGAAEVLALSVDMSDADSIPAICSAPAGFAMMADLPLIRSYTGFGDGLVSD